MLSSMKDISQEVSHQIGSLIGILNIGGTIGLVVAAISKYYSAAPEIMHKLLLVGAILYVMDSILGVIDSKINKKKAFSSNRMGQGILKLTVYMAFYILALCVDIAAGTLFSAQILALSAIVSREGKSNLEHLHNLERFTKIKIPRWLGEKYDVLDGDKDTAVVNSQPEAKPVTQPVIVIEHALPIPKDENDNPAGNPTI